MAETDESNDNENGAPDGVSQADLFDNLKRIGELEDQKQTIQAEIDSLMSGLKAAIPQLDKGSLLFQMLSNTLAQPKATSAKATTKKTSKRSVRKTTTKKK